MKTPINILKSVLFFIVVSFTVSGQIRAQQNHHHNRKIEFPNIPAYKTLKCDLHQHTVFSDGDVWPTIRVEEALKDGLDAISITEHLEVQPHKEDIPHPDRNRAYQIALKKAEGSPLMIIKGAEITRDMPPGHINAIFIEDANKLLHDDVISSLREAKRQDAFIFWNHPNWVAQNPDGIAKLTPMHHQLLKEKLIHGIEVVNEFTYSDEALQVGIDNNLTIMGTSDIHGLIDWDYKPLEGGHRPITLVFAKEKSQPAIKEGLENQRTVVWFNNTLIGDTEYLVPLIQASLIIKKVEALKGNDIVSSVHSVYVENVSDANYILENKSGYTLHNHTDIIVLKAHETTLIQVKTLKALANFNLRFKVLNAISAPNTHPEIVLKIKVEK